MSFPVFTPSTYLVPETHWEGGAEGGAGLNSKSKVYLENTKAACLKLSEQEKDSNIENVAWG